MFRGSFRLIAATAIIVAILCSAAIVPLSVQADDGTGNLPFSVPPIDDAKIPPPSASASNTLTVTNGYLKATVGGTAYYTPGAYTIGTGALHPYANQNILYGGGTESPYTSWNSIRFYEALLEYGPGTRTPSTGYTWVNINSTPPSVTASGRTITTVWTIPNPSARVTQVVTVDGTTLSNSTVCVTTTVTNTGASSFHTGLRYLWDLCVDGNDNSVFKPAEETFTNQCTTYEPPSFNTYEITNSLTTPYFSLTGSLNSVTDKPARLVYTNWGYASAGGFEYGYPTGYAGDSALLFYWGLGSGIALQPGMSTSVTTCIGRGAEQASPFQLATNDATNITSSSAILNGSIGYGMDYIIYYCYYYGPTKLSFQYGTRKGVYTEETPAKQLTMSMIQKGKFSADISLNRYAGQTIYYRAKLAGCGIRYGAEKWFDVPASSATPKGSWLPGTTSTATPTDSVRQVPVSMPSISVRNASLAATQVAPGEPLTVNAEVANTGTANGSSSIKLYVNGELESTQGVTVSSGSSTPITFQIIRNEPGTYSVYVDSANAGTFTVDALSGPMPIVIGAVLFFAIMLAAIIFISRRNAQARP